MIGWLPWKVSHGEGEIITELVLNVRRLSRNQWAMLNTERKLPPRRTLGSAPIGPSQGNAGEGASCANARIGNELPTLTVPAAMSIPFRKSRRLIPSSCFL